MEALVIQSAKGQDVTTSLIVADVFGKNHAHVLRDIENLGCSLEFSQSNFGQSKYTNERGREYPLVEMTKDGFSFLVMGYTGGKASEFKEKFIKEFNKRESLLKNDDFILSRALTILNERTKLLEAQVEQVEEQLQLANRTIEQQAPIVGYAQKALLSTSCYVTTAIAKELGIGAPTLNKRLHELGVQYDLNGQWVLYAKYQNKGLTQTRTHTYYDRENHLHTSLQTVWTEKGRQLIHSLINPPQNFQAAA